MAKKKFLFDWTPIVALFDTCTVETAAPRDVVLTFSASPGKPMRGMTTANFKVALTAAPYTVKDITACAYDEGAGTITITTSVAHAFANGQAAHTLTFWTGKTANTKAITNNVA
jgi:hypothetical protein